MSVFIGAISKDKKRELVVRIKELIRLHGINFFDIRVYEKWNDDATKLIDLIELKSSQNSNVAAFKFYKKAKYDNFKILNYHLKKLQK